VGTNDGINGNDEGNDINNDAPKCLPEHCATISTNHEPFVTFPEDFIMSSQMISQI
jgi:hypothetical protein